MGSSTLDSPDSKFAQSASSTKSKSTCVDSDEEEEEEQKFISDFYSSATPVSSSKDPFKSW